MRTESIDEAIGSLRAREETLIRNIGIWQTGNRCPRLIGGLPVWAENHDITAVIWTNLGRKFEKQKAPATAEQVIAHLKSLKGEPLKKAAEYIRRAPCQVNTAYRQKIIETLGWITPASDESQSED
jgi:hypothetical protein